MTTWDSFLDPDGNHAQIGEVGAGCEARASHAQLERDARRNAERDTTTSVLRPTAGKGRTLKEAHREGKRKGRSSMDSSNSSHGLDSGAAHSSGKLKARIREELPAPRAEH